MKNIARASLIALTVASVTGLMGAPRADAVTWTRTAPTTQYAYSWNGYRASVSPAASPKVTGYTPIKRWLTATSGGRTYARAAASASLGAGTYTVYSTSQYRAWVGKRVAYTAYRTVSTTFGVCHAGTPNEAIATSAPALVDAGTGLYRVGVKGAGSVQACTSSATKALTMTGDAYVYKHWGALPKIGDVVSRPAEVDMSEDIRADAPQWIYPDTFTLATNHAYTAYKTVYNWAYTYRYTVRTATVKRAYNSPTVTWSEYLMSKPGMTLAKTRSIYGSNGTLVYDSSYLGRLYRWKSNSGAVVNVWFSNGVMTERSWS